MRSNSKSGRHRLRFWLYVVAGFGGAVLMMATSSADARLDSGRPFVIAHRGASGYVPEHTLAGYFIACILGSIAGIYLLLRHGSRYLPFGPVLALGSFSLVLGPQAFARLLRWYAGLFD